MQAPRQILVAGKPNRKALLTSQHMMQASCLCGSTAFNISGDLRSARYCHCANCRKFAGTSPATWAMAKSSKLKVTSSDAGESKFNSGLGLRYFCANCGSPLWFESLDYPEITAIPLGVLDSGDIPAPEMHLWTESNPEGVVSMTTYPNTRKIPSRNEETPDKP